MLVASAARADKAEARSVELDAKIAQLKRTIAKMKRAEYGTSSEKGAPTAVERVCCNQELVTGNAAGK